MLDGHSLLDIEPASDPNDLPVTVKSGFSDSSDTLRIGQMFLLKFFELFDTNRNGLANFYEDSSCFSLQVADSLRKDQPTAELLFKQWWPFQRSLMKVTQTGMYINCFY